MPASRPSGSRSPGLRRDGCRRAAVHAGHHDQPRRPAAHDGRQRGPERPRRLQLGGRPAVRDPADVPAAQSAEFTDIGGRPTDFQATDAIVGAAARCRLSVLPTVLYTPSWDARRTANPRGGIRQPRPTGPYAAYLTALIGRYGPRRQLLAPEPAHSPRCRSGRGRSGTSRMSAGYLEPAVRATYVALLRAAHAAVKRADPGGQGRARRADQRRLERAATRSTGPRRPRAVRRRRVNAFTKLPANVIRYLQLRARGDDALRRPGESRCWPPSSAGPRRGRATQATTSTRRRPARPATSPRCCPCIGRDRADARPVRLLLVHVDRRRARRATPPSISPGSSATPKRQVTAKPALAAFRTGVLALEGCRARARWPPAASGSPRRQGPHALQAVAPGVTARTRCQRLRRPPAGRRRTPPLAPSGRPAGAAMPYQSWQSARVALRA